MSVEFRGPASSAEIVNGVVALEEDQLAVDFERETWTGKKKLIHVLIPIDDIDYAEYRSGFVGGKIRVRMLYLEDIKDLPWRSGLSVDFVVSRGERERAKQLVERVEAEIERREAASEGQSSV